MHDGPEPVMSHSGRLAHYAFPGDRRTMCGAKIALHAYASQATGTCTPCQKARERYLQNQTEPIAA